MKIEKDYLILEDKDLTKIKKITATNLTALLGTNKWKKRGDALLSILNLYKEIIDPFYTKRGEIAELILREKLKQKGMGIKFWDKFEIGFDNFPTRKDFGGMIDIAITSPTRQIVECKSKNIAKKEETMAVVNDDYEHQAMLYGYLAKCDDINLIYVFFTDEQENKIRKGESLSTDPALYTFYGYKVKLDKQKFEEELKECLRYKNECIANRKIPLVDISDKVLEYLKLK
jgi:hypothetical protein